MITIPQKAEEQMKRRMDLTNFILGLKMGLVKEMQKKDHGLGQFPPPRLSDDMRQITLAYGGNTECTMSFLDSGPRLKIIVFLDGLNGSGSLEFGIDDGGEPFRIFQNGSGPVPDTEISNEKFSEAIVSGMMRGNFG